MNTLLIFTYVAIWHDMTFKLLLWGWLAGVAFIPEVRICTKKFKRKENRNIFKYDSLRLLKYYFGSKILYGIWIVK